MHNMPLVGTVAPDFTLPDQGGESRTLSSYRGRWTLIYFYPKDDTPGCTTEACEIRDAFPQFDTNNITVLGISADSVKSHKKFAEKYELPFTLLADEDHVVAETYGVWGEKKFMGRTSTGIKRTSFLINDEGEITKVYEKVKPELHAAEVLREVAAFSV